MHLDLLDAILISRSSHRFSCCSVVDVVAVVAALFSCSSLFIINTVLYIDLRLDDSIQPSMNHWRLVFVITITLLCVLVWNFCTGCCFFLLVEYSVHLHLLRLSPCSGDGHVVWDRHPCFCDANSTKILSTFQLLWSHSTAIRSLRRIFTNRLFLF